MAGISSKAAGSLTNKKGYNGNELQNKEFSDGSGLELYDFNARTYDQQIGRFIQKDPESEEADQESWSPYHFTFDNPIIHSDPDGTHPIIPIIYRAYRIIQLLREVPWSRNAGRELPIATRDNVTTIIRVVTPILKDALTPQVVTPPVVKKTETTKTEGEIKQLEKSKGSYEKLIKEHKEKLEKFKEDPVAGTKKELLEGKPPDVQKKIMDGRVNALEKQIKKQEGELNKINEQLKTKKEELKKD